MAKKKAKAGKKKTRFDAPRKGKKPAPRQSKRDAEKLLRSGPVRRRAEKARDQPLPGMEEVRYRDLDNTCNSIAETREEINTLRADETAFEQTALRQMRTHGITSYRHAGVELVRVPGEEKLRVRTARERTATAETEEPDDKGDTGDLEPMDGLAGVGGNIDLTDD
jgi:hypothetical protein